MRILITGVNGFIGSHLARHMLDLGHEVTGLVRTTSDLKAIQNLPLRLVHGDITNPDSIIAAFAGIEIVVHTAGAVTDWGSMDYFEKSNLAGVQNIARAAVQAGVKRLVHISTVAIYGFNVKNAPEDSPTPDSHVGYSITKLKAVQWLQSFTLENRLELVVINPGNVFGPGDEKFILPYLDIIHQNKFVYVGGGRSATCPTYIENLVHGIALACFHPGAAGETFNITDGLDITWRQFTDALYKGLGKDLITRSVPRNLVYVVAFAMEKLYQFFGIHKPPLLTRYRIDNASLDYHFSIDKARKLLGYQPPVDFETAVSRTVDWYLKFRANIK